ncbi:MAG: hypothetical protein H7Y27_07660, partial [Gemmatimonadaceae bacterium]|nr:hypothetical protein [Chitinophagaceae bacterium]
MISLRFLAIALVSAAIMIGAGCAGRISIALPPSSNSLITGDSFYAAVSGMWREDRENFALKEILS